MISNIAQIGHEIWIGVSRSGECGASQKWMIGEVVDRSGGALFTKMTFGVQLIKLHFVVVPQVLHIHYFLNVKHSHKVTQTVHPLV